jgi:hypothetical protein
MGASAEQAIGAQKAKQQQQTGDFDTRTNAIETQRQNQLKDIGNYGNAVRESAMVKNQEVQTAKAYASMLKPPRPGAPVTRVTPDNTQVQWNPDNGVWDVSMTSDGKPVKVNPNVGPKGGVRNTDTAGMKNYNFLTSKGVDENTATAIAFRQKSGDPTKDHLSVYNSTLRATGGDQGAAKMAADGYVSEMYGATANGPQPKLIPPQAPKVAPPVGKIGTDAQGNKWKNDGKGNAVLVSRAS